jgi:hypothetical protein
MLLFPTLNGEQGGAALSQIKGLYTVERDMRANPEKRWGAIDVYVGESAGKQQDRIGN